LTEAAHLFQSGSAALQKPVMKSVLFLCTGNYYRSRFAEELFNHHAALAGLDWTATSAALAIERGAANVGPLSPHTLEALNGRGVRALRATHYPRACVADDLQTADLIVALDDTEHRPRSRRAGGR
jgi:protein-tyrosine phosphatase